MIIFDCDINTQADLQIIGRANKLAQTQAVEIYRFYTKDTVEEKIVEIAKRKLILDYGMKGQSD